MDDRASLKPAGLAMRLGPSSEFFAGFRTGAGKHLRSKNNDSEWGERPKKKPEDRIRYSRDFLLKKKQVCLEMPLGVNAHIPCFGIADMDNWSKNEYQVRPQPPNFTNYLDCVTKDEEEDFQDPGWKQRGGSADGEDPSLHQNGAAKPRPDRQDENPKVLHIQKAEELGREAYRPRAAQDISDDERALRQVKGTLNKLTPNNFDRLLQQITDLIKNADILKKSISLVFEKAVAEPTFCALYADLCERLSKQIPDFPPLEGETKKLTFRRVLLNTCQDEFEGVESYREKLESIEDPTERQAAEKSVKDRTLGNVRLIAELFNKGLVSEKILHSCLRDLLSTPREVQLPHEDNLEAACEVLTLAGKKLFQGQANQSNSPVYMQQLEKYSKTKGVPSRIVFLIRDVMDMQRNNWVPRREKFTAKKIEEIHAEAVSELGIQIRLPQIKHQLAKADLHDDIELFPMPKGVSSSSEWKAVADRLSKGPAGQKEAKPVVSKPVSQAREFKSEEERDKAALSLYTEYISSADKSEAVLCAEEIISGDALHAKRLVEIGLDHLMDCVSERDHKMIVEILSWFLTKGIMDSEAFLEGIKTKTDQLDDLLLDVPKSPELCGRVVGKVISDGHLSISVLPQLCQPILGAESRRPFVLSVFSGVKEEGNDVDRLCKESAIAVKPMLEADPSFDMPDMESVEDFLSKTEFMNLPL